MGNFRSGSRDDFRGNRGSGGRREGGFRRDNRDSGGYGGGRGRDRDRRPVEMHDVTCDKCGKDCQVPFKPTGDKPVLCSDCFRKEGGSDRGPRDRSGGSGQDLKKIEAKIDKILKILESAEIEEDDEDEFEDDKSKDSEAEGTT